MICFFFLSPPSLDSSLFPKDAVVTFLPSSPGICTSQSQWASHVDAQEGDSKDVESTRARSAYLSPTPKHAKLQMRIRKFAARSRVCFPGSGGDRVLLQGDVYARKSFKRKK